MARLLLPLFAVAILGCGRYFPGPLTPTAPQAADMEVKDDGSVVYTKGRLTVTLRAVTDEQLNRQFPAANSQGRESTNPYTFGEWKPMGDTYTPARFTVFWLQVSNYAYPKVQFDPYRAVITTSNERTYKALRLDELSEYFRAYALGLTGNRWSLYKERLDVLRRTMFSRAPLFSGQDTQGYIVFPPLDDDVTRLKVALDGIVLRFNYADEPLETTDLTFSFAREVLRGMHPPARLTGTK
jgi:hypothetical protein